MAHKIEFRVGSQTYVAAVEKKDTGHLVFLEEDRFPYYVSRGGIVSRDHRTPRKQGDGVLCRTAVELAKEFLEE